MSLDGGISHQAFHAPQGGTEHYITVQAPRNLDLGGQIAALEGRYAQARQSLGLAPESAVFRRLFLSDIINQAAAVGESGLVAEPHNDPVAVSMVQQAPLSGERIAMLAYHVEGPEPVTKRRLSPHHMIVEKAGLRHLWSTRLCSGADDFSHSAMEQTYDVFNDLIHALSNQSGNLARDCVRTWVYVKGIDTFYQQMVDARRELFARQGMTGDTHYIASTGIEGACAHHFDVVAMDAYSVLGLAPGQMSYLNDFSRLCATKDYHVTFERGTRIAYADRAHNFISGTASIDRAGQVMHAGDVLAQLEHAIANVDALLNAGGSGISDLMHLIVYLRDPTEFARVDEHLKNRYPELPRLIVQGAVCRPEWLVEVEGIAIAANHDPALPAF